MVEPHVVTLRATRADDLDELFRIQLDPEANRMAAFTPEDPSDRAAFDAHWRRLFAREDVDSRTVRCDGRIVGSVSRWIDAESRQPEITYWIDRSEWGRGIATRAVRLFLDSQPRPVRARAAADNAASVAVLGKLGFVEVGRDRGYANARRAEIDEIEFELR
ncbi:GNAT family N-acetyltransferase [Agromyces aurantiacus]|uniref:GNAT family N-acetyltransferase n=1 Tax=Agromyces aurantiacus TaxID=165814 RepID=A0ABV9R8Z9_9MICO|nr:GNAT family N-acetyltransferase [Agromyces aurantiacus]MBM7504437.1 RimJ/RimL family protein N-acetyltransferase [Agromyces aurantiacus]